MNISYNNYGLSGQYDVEDSYDELFCGSRCQKRKKEKRAVRNERRRAKNDSRKADNERTRVETEILKNNSIRDLAKPAAPVYAPPVASSVAPNQGLSMDMLRTNMYPLAPTETPVPDVQQAGFGSSKGLMIGGGILLLLLVVKGKDIQAAMSSKAA